MWNINLNNPAKNMKGILLLFRGSGSKCYNPKIDKISITVEGVSNQLYAQGIRRYINTGMKFRNILEIREKKSAWE